MKHKLLKGGSMGAGNILQSTRILSDKIPNIKVNVICGHNEELFNEIQERIIERYIRLMAWEEIEKISTLNFHVRMRECDLLKLYQYYIFDRSRQRLIVNAKPYDNDQLYVNILGNRINLNDILIGDHYKWNPEKFPKIYDGSFKDFLESFDFEANGICRVHDSIYASDENDILIGRKMKSVIDKLF